MSAPRPAVASVPTEATYGPLEVRHWATLEGPYRHGFGVYYRRPKGPRMGGTLLHLGDLDSFDDARAAAFELAHTQALKAARSPAR